MYYFVRLQMPVLCLVGRSVFLVHQRVNRYHQFSVEQIKRISSFELGLKFEVKGESEQIKGDIFF